MQEAQTLTPKVKKRVAVVGARGYSGLELCRLLLNHPGADLRTGFATAPFDLCDSLTDPRAAQVAGHAIQDLIPMASSLDLVFLATPATTSMELAPQLLEAGCDVIDMSGAFRLQTGSVAANYKTWYGFDHLAPQLVTRATYGLIPWSNTEKDSRPKLIANPGCFATAILMGLLPLLKNGLIDPSTLVIDAKSGTTGAGKKAEERLLHAEVDGGCFPYRIGRHQHTPEITQFAQVFANVEIDPHFTTHLLNVRRGILAGIYAQTAASVEKIRSVLNEVYAREPLVDVFELNDKNEASVLNLRRVAGTARTRMAYKVVGKKIYVFSLIDNLMKGAASQAIENFNRLSGLPASSTLVEMEGVI